MIPTLTLEATGDDIGDCATRQTLGEKELPGIRARPADGGGRGCSAIRFASMAARGGTLEEVVKAAREAVTGLEFRLRARTPDPGTV
ncbi:hypothetical protein [Streptomyces megasporus]|uniref:hypothetical protein n=1 Tax=Streptomyces megasporus TaxID=44060 RepID=UPI0012FF2BBE|nr:hypothetical protein [Streptomyces megasporus]